MKNLLINKDDRILIAGGSGMAGGAIYRAFQKAGYSKLLIPTRKELDLSKKNDVDKWFSEFRPNLVIIAAAKVGGIYANSNEPANFLLDNIKIQNHLIEAAWINKCKRTLFLGSSCIYPKFCEQPISEESLLTGSLEITNESYAIAKISGIKLIEALRNQYGFDGISLMPTNLYGTGDNYHKTSSHVLPALIRRFHEAKINQDDSITCWGTGKPLREFLHSDDLGEACLFVLENWDPRHQNSPKDNKGKPLTFLNVGTGLDLSISQLAHKIADIVEYKGEILWDTSKPDGTPKKQLNISRIKELGWKPRVNLMQGLEMAYKSFQDDLKEGKLRL